MTRLADLIAAGQGQYGGDLPRSAVVDAVNADGTVDLQYLGGTALSVPIISTYTPVAGDTVQIMRRGPASLIVLGALKATATGGSGTVTSDLAMPWNVQAVPTVISGGGSSGTLTIRPVSSGSHRSADGWGSPLRDELRQGAYSSSTRYGYYSGAWFYGTGAFADLKGRTVTRIQLTIRRATGSGVYAAEPIYVWTTKNAVRPSGAPYFVSKVGEYRLAVGDTGTFTLPDWVGQRLANGTALGLGIRYSGTSDYLAVVGRGAYVDSGRLLIDWRED